MGISEALKTQMLKLSISPNALSVIDTHLDLFLSYYPKEDRSSLQSLYEKAIASLLDPHQWHDLISIERKLATIQLSIQIIFPQLTVPQKKRIGVFGWGVVAPSVENITEFQQRLKEPGTWMKPYQGFGNSNFWVGQPKFDLSKYHTWIVDRFGSKRYVSLESKMGDNVKMTVGAFIQALDQNPGIEKLLQDLKHETHIYIGTAMSDMPLQEAMNSDMDTAVRRWHRFWAHSERCSERKDYESMKEADKKAFLENHNAPKDPEQIVESDDEALFLAKGKWNAFWSNRSDSLKTYLKESAAIHHVNIFGDVETDKLNVLKNRLVELRKLQKKWGCPTEPWAMPDSQNRLWNIDNIMAAQVSMMGKITGLATGPSGACSTFGVCLELAIHAIQSNRAKVVVIGAVEPLPQKLEIACFYDAKVLSNDGNVCKPFTGLRGTHVSGGACVWIVADTDYMIQKGFKPVGSEIIGIGTTSDADHIITPSKEGPQNAIRLALEDASIKPEDIQVWDCHATATPGDVNEVKSITELLGNHMHLVARKGQFGHGMSVCGGWELTALMMSLRDQFIYGTDLNAEEINPEIRKMNPKVVTQKGIPLPGPIAGKTNMGVGGINAVVLLKRWDFKLTPQQFAWLNHLTADEMRHQIEQGKWNEFRTESGELLIPFEYVQ